MLAHMFASSLCSYISASYNSLHCIGSWLLILIILFTNIYSLSFNVWLQSGRDAHGAGIALFTAQLHIPVETTHQAVLKALIYLLDAALER